MLITHDLGIVAQSCERVMVMYCGKIIESSPVAELFSSPKHPYSRGLLDSIPVIRREKVLRLPSIEGMVANLSQLPKGCRYQERCGRAQADCKQTEPNLVETSAAGHSVACYHPLEYTQK